MEKHRIGSGFDIHKIDETKNVLFLGGVEIACNFGLEAVSDGDVVLHAVSDALCGACGLGDIGDYFPPSKRYQGMDSKKIVEFILNKIGNSFRIENIDLTIIAERPRLVSYKDKIVKSLRDIFAIASINVKAKSKEGMNILGGSNAICAMAVVLVTKFEHEDS